ncbi:MAG: putative selenium-dependent hydroxylase accessory protein YqeC [Anaerolineaceae bacterium]|nr:putative selenium-dependent hydroxylase accessory protein YqeC [Anaerolineaceae bacterium]
MDLSPLISFLGPRPRLAIVGAGGKSSLLFRLARLYGRALLTNSAHLFIEQTHLADRCLTVTAPADVPEQVGAGLTLLTGPIEDARGRALGLDEACLERVLALAERLDLPLLIEADGSRCLPLKAPAAHEPPIPPWVDAVAVVVGLSALGRPLDGATVYRPEDFAALSGLALGELVTPEALARLLTHPQGGLKNIPTGVRCFAFLNQADHPAVREQAAELARLLLPVFDAVAVASLHGTIGPEEAQLHALYAPTAGVLLAAGESRRLGRPKQLVEWQGQPLVRRAAQTALQAGLDPVVVVTGAFAAEVQAALEGLPVQVVFNPNWAAGQSASLRTGLETLPERTQAALFLLADQPYLTPELIQALTHRHAETQAAIVAPRAGGRRANPVLFGRCAFPELLALQGDAGGRQIIDRYPVEYVDWPDDRILLDVDTPDDLREIRGGG